MALTGCVAGRGLCAQALLVIVFILVVSKQQKVGRSGSGHPETWEAASSRAKFEIIKMLYGKVKGSIALAGSLGCVRFAHLNI